MTTAVQYQGRTISVSRQTEGYVWLYDDGGFLTAGTDYYTTRQEALQAAKEEIRKEDQPAEVTP
jgi:hypothetical protein